MFLLYFLADLAETLAKSSSIVLLAVATCKLAVVHLIGSILLNVFCWGVFSQHFLFKMNLRHFKTSVWFAHVSIIK